MVTNPNLPACMLARASLFPSFIERRGEKVPVIVAHIPGLPEFKVVMPQPETAQ